VTTGEEVRAGVARLLRRGRVLGAGVIFAAIAAAWPALAPAAVPASAWYWTMVVSPSSPNVLLLGTGHGLYRSTDGGKTWQATGPAGLDATSLVESGGTVLAAGVQLPSLAGPTVSTNGVYLVADGPPVLAESSDGGSTWRQVAPKGLPAVGVQALAASPSNERVVYAVLRNGAVYRSRDGGGSFAPVVAKIGGTPWALAVAPAGRLVAGDMTTGAYESANGTAWQPSTFSDPKGGKMVMEYAVQPGNASHLLMTSYGVLSSTDGGKTWQPSLKSGVMFGPVAFAPGAPSVAYAVGWDHSLWRTADAGTTWSRVA
jgi:photosystem II stability/assembly factor-like uncharacterized protein